jgi:flagellar motor switch protein FliN/FliY
MSGDTGVTFEEMDAPGRDMGLMSGEKNAADLEAVFDVPVRISVPVANLLKMDIGTIVELDRQVGESVEIYVNERLIARGEIVLVDGRLGVTMTEIIKAS